MMRRILAAALLVASVASVSAQNRVGQVTIQPKLGMNIASITKSEDGDNRIGLAAGAEFEVGLTDMVGLSGGLLYSMQGEKCGSVTTKLDYINVPILANVYVAKGLAVKMGVQPGFNVNAKVKAKESGVTAEADIDGVKSIDFSIPVGLSYEFDRFVVDARYNWGITKIVSHESCKNSVVQITVGYKFAL